MRSHGWSDVLVDPEEIARIVTVLEFDQTLVAGPVRRFESSPLLLGHKVDVGLAGGVLGDRIPQVLAPPDAALILRGIAPATVHIHDVRGAAPLVGGRFVGYAALLTTDLGEEDLALGVRKLGYIPQHFVDQFVAHLRKVVRLPVVTLTRGQQRIECLLPAREGLRADHIGNRVSDGT